MPGGDAGPGAGRGKGRRGSGHVLLCQGYRFRVGRGDHEADPGGADRVPCAVGHFPNVAAVPAQGVVGSAADLALGDRNRSQQHGKNDGEAAPPHPQPLLRLLPESAPCQKLVCLLLPVRSLQAPSCASCDSRGERIPTRPEMRRRFQGCAPAFLLGEAGS